MKKNHSEEYLPDDMDMNDCSPLMKMSVKIALVGAAFFGLFALILLIKAFGHGWLDFSQELLNPARLWKNAWMPTYIALGLAHLFFVIPLLVRFNDAVLVIETANHDLIIMTEIFCVIGVILGLAFGFSCKSVFGLIFSQGVNLILAGIIASAIIFAVSFLFGLANLLLSYGLFFGFWCASFFHYAAGFGICALSAGEKFSGWYMLSLIGLTFFVLGINFFTFVFFNHAQSHHYN